MQATRCALVFTMLCGATLVSATAAELQPQTENGVTWVCGGVGVDQAAAIQQAAPDYRLMLTFTADDGSYLADVDVTIDGNGDQPVLHTSCAGPIMLVNLPAAGSYQLRASVNGHTQTRRLQLRSASAHQRLVLRWPAAQAGLEAAPARVRSQAGEQS